MKRAIVFVALMGFIGCISKTSTYTPSKPLLKALPRVALSVTNQPIPGYYTNFCKVVYRSPDTNNYLSVTGTVSLVMIVPGPIRLKIFPDSLVLTEGFGMYMLQESDDLKTWKDVKRMIKGDRYCIPSGKARGFFRVKSDYSNFGILVTTSD